MRDSTTCDSFAIPRTSPSTFTIKVENVRGVRGAKKTDHVRSAIENRIMQHYFGNCNWNLEKIISELGHLRGRVVTRKFV